MPRPQPLSPRRALLTILTACACILGIGEAGIAATSGSIVGATVPSATSLSAAGCAPNVLNRTHFGNVTPGSTNVTSDDCTIVWGSSNDSSSLRIQQADGRGIGMWAPTPTPDTSFGGGVVSDAAVGTRASSVLEQPDGKVLVGGRNGANWFIARYLANGTLDPGFGTAGVATDTQCSTQEGVTGLALLPDGRIAYSHHGSCASGGVGRLTAAGQFDPTYGGGDGRADSIGGGTYDLAALADGTTYVVRFHQVRRFTPSGADDTGFSGDGQAPLPGGATSPQGIAVDELGRVYVVALRNGHGVVIRYLPDGTPDPAFSGGLVELTHPVVYAEDVAVLADGAVAATGTATAAGGGGWVAVLDGTGAVRSEQTLPSSVIDFAAAVEPLPDGGFLAIGSDTTDGTVVRMDGSGTMSSSYGLGRLVGSAFGTRVDVGADGRTFAVGRTAAGVMTVHALQPATMPQHADGSADFDQGTGFMGACLRTAGATTAWPSDGTCQASDATDWNDVPASSEIIASSATFGSFTSTLRFGLRVPSSQRADRYLAPITFTVLAPAA